VKGGIVDVHRSGYVALCGQTNVGKSTLLNGILGEKIAIVSRKPQTTRTRIAGIKNIPGAQLIFLDSPGLHAGHTSLDRYMLEQAKRVLYESQVALLMVDARNRPEEEWGYLETYVTGIGTPILLVINKIDLLPSRESLLPLMEAYAGLFDFREIIPVSALRRDGVDIVIARSAELLPEGPPLFPDDMITDLPERVIAAEVVREKIYELLHQEIPYAAAVVVEKFEERKDRNLLVIGALVYVEKDSQKAIVIGKKGTMLREIGRRSRMELESFFGVRVFLELWVKVEKNWSRKLESLDRFGYSG
jgi:GTP-binding protein Era